VAAITCSKLRRWPAAGTLIFLTIVANPEWFAPQVLFWHLERASARGSKETLAGLIDWIQHKWTKNGELMRRSREEGLYVG
jgi:ribulose kinase